MLSIDNNSEHKLYRLGKGNNDTKHYNVSSFKFLKSVCSCSSLTSFLFAFSPLCRCRWVVGRSPVSTHSCCWLFSCNLLSFRFFLFEVSESLCLSVLVFGGFFQGIMFDSFWSSLFSTPLFLWGLFDCYLSP